MEPGLRVDYAKAPKQPLERADELLIYAIAVFVFTCSIILLTPMFEAWVIAGCSSLWMIPLGRWIDRRKPPMT